jgi:ribose-phosphate pyrophosphokinase
VATVDAHSIATFDNAFRCHKEHVEATDVFASYLAQKVSDAQRLVVLSPDAGGVHRARRFSSLLAERSGRLVELAFMEKQRSGGRVSGEAFAGDVNDAFVVIYDDMISTGGTVARAARAAAERGARAVHCAATHGLFSGDAVATLNAVPLVSLVITDTVADATERCAGLRCDHAVLDSAGLFREALAEPRRSAPLNL